MKRTLTGIEETQTPVTEINSSYRFESFYGYISESEYSRIYTFTQTKATAHFNSVEANEKNSCKPVPISELPAVEWIGGQKLGG